MEDLQELAAVMQLFGGGPSALDELAQVIGLTGQIQNQDLALQGFDQSERRLAANIDQTQQGLDQAASRDFVQQRQAREQLGLAMEQATTQERLGDEGLRLRSEAIGVQRDLGDRNSLLELMRLKLAQAQLPQNIISSLDGVGGNSVNLLDSFSQEQLQEAQRHFNR